MTHAQIEAKNVIHDAMSADLQHGEFVAVDGTGRVVSKANSREAVELAAPHHSGIFAASELKHLTNKTPEPIDGTPGPVGAEATTLPSENSFEKILAHVEKTRDSEAVHERQLGDAEKVIKATEDAKPAGQKKAEAEAEANKNPTSPVKKTPDGEIVPNKPAAKAADTPAKHRQESKK